MIFSHVELGNSFVWLQVNNKTGTCKLNECSKSILFIITIVIQTNILKKMKNF